MSSDFHVYNDWHPPREPESTLPRMVRWVMRRFGIKNEIAANMALTIFSVCAFLLSLYFFFIF